MLCSWRNLLCAIRNALTDWARQMGLQSPQAGQVIRMDSGSADSATPVMASIAPVAVISVR